MVRDKILVIGASGQIGVELTLALRQMYGEANVVASDLREENPLLNLQLFMASVNMPVSSGVIIILIDMGLMSEVYVIPV